MRGKALRANYGRRRKADRVADNEQKSVLKKLKGYTRTFVVHSNTSPYAAAAAMGTAVGRSRALGPYFHLSAERISGVQGKAGTGAVSELAPSGLKVDFRGDWEDFLRQTGMAFSGLEYEESRTLEENTMRYLNAHNRRIPITAQRAVHESRELSVPQEYAADYVTLKSLINSGGDLKPYLSRDISKRNARTKMTGYSMRGGYNTCTFGLKGLRIFCFAELQTQRCLSCRRYHTIMTCGWIHRCCKFCMTIGRMK